MVYVNPQFKAAPSSPLAGRELGPTVVKQGTDDICESQAIPSFLTLRKYARKSNSFKVWK